MKKGNLLIVDDESEIVENIKILLNDLAAEVFTACNGLEAIELIKKHQIHCIVCDINMPIMNGVELIRAIRSEKNNVPFIFYTGHGNQDLMMEAVKYGAFDFLDKPELSNLEEVVSRGLSEGTDGSSDLQLSDETFLSEYQKLLQSLEKE